MAPQLHAPTEAIGMPRHRGYILRPSGLRRIRTRRTGRRTGLAIRPSASTRHVVLFRRGTTRTHRSLGIGHVSRTGKQLGHDTGAALRAQRRQRTHHHGGTTTTTTTAPIARSLGTAVRCTVLHRSPNGILQRGIISIRCLPFRTRERIRSLQAREAYDSEEYKQITPPY